MTTPVPASGEVVEEPPPIGPPASSIAIVAVPDQPSPPAEPRPARMRGKLGTWRYRTAPTVGDPGAFAPSLRRAGVLELQLPQVMQNAPFRRYWLGQMVALLGVWTQNTAAQLVILSLTSSAFLIGAINIVSAIPLLLLSLLGGVLADRADRRRIIMSTQTMIATLSLVWAMLIVTDRIVYWHVLVLAAIGGSVASFDLPASQAFLGQLVRRNELPEAIAMTSASVNATRSFGPALAGVVIGAFGTGVAFVSHSLALFVFIGAIFSMRALLPIASRTRPSTTGLASLRAGLHHIRGSDELIGLVGTTALFSFLAVPILLVLMPLFVTRVLGGGDGWVPATTSIFGLGSFVAAVTMFRASRLEAASGRRLRLTAFGLAVGLLWLSLSPNPWVAIPGVLISGCSFELGLIQVQTRLQQLAPEEMRGRVMSVNGVAFNGVMPLATFTISSASVALGLPVVMGICAAALAAGSWLLWKRYTWKAFVPANALA